LILDLDTGDPERQFVSRPHARFGDARSVDECAVSRPEIANGERVS
jgi:hypothetical protein